MAVAVLSAAADYDARLRRATQIVTCHPTITWALAAVALTAGAAYWHATGRYDPYSAGPLHLIWAGVALFVMLPAVFGRSERGLPGRVLSTRLLAWLGLVSYGIYLWHLPLVPKLGHLSSNVVGERVGGSAQTIALFLVVVAVTVICAAGSYYLMERPILRFKEGFTRRHLTRWSARVALDEQ
jgi:peptidoglycan/LPS O-acetylase OafA/YrhL